MSYGASVGYMLRDNPEAMRVWSGGEAAATTAGSGAEEGAAIGQAVGKAVDSGNVSADTVRTLATVVVVAKLTRGKGVSSGGGAKISNLTPGQQRRIQNAANRSGQTITVVGSRAAGTAKPNSDWDYVVDANSKTRNNLSRSLPGAGNLSEGERPNIDVFRGQVDKSLPYIEFTPEP